MLDRSLPAEKLAELRAAHRSTLDKGEADRNKAVLALAGGWGAEDVAAGLQIDGNGVRNHSKKTLHDHYFETFAEFKSACEAFFANPAKGVGG